MNGRAPRPLRLGAALAAALLASSQARLLSGEVPVLVRFDALALVYAQDGLPRLRADGTLLVPAATTCALIGATCERKSLTMRATLGDVSVQLPVTDDAGNAFVPLRLLGNGLGLSVTWQPTSRSALVGGAANRGDLAAISEFLPANAASGHARRLWARFEPRPDSRLLNVTVRATSGPLVLGSVFSKLSTGALSVIGEATKGTPDNPSVPFACSGPVSTCTVAVDRDALYALAQVR